MPLPVAQVRDELTARLGAEKVSDRALDRYALAHDASHYLLIPSLVVRPRSAEQVAAVLASCARANLPLTFRAGGTSLSGQGVTDSVLVDVRRHFRGVEVLDEGKRVRVEPGVTIGMINARLARHRRRLGPDPASESACTVGGVVANNSSGMTCGTEFNTYATLESLIVVLASGTVVDTGAADADEHLRAKEPELHGGLLRLRDRVRGNPASVSTVRRLFGMKNTMGYGVNAFLDFDEPAQILAHLMVGSEGTLGFVSSVTLRTIPIRSHVVSGLFVFPDVVTAAAAVPGLVAAGAATAELLDAASLRVAARDPGCPAVIAGLEVVNDAALLLEWESDHAEELEETARGIEFSARSLPLVQPGKLTAAAAERAALWRVRKGLYSAVAGARPAGTNALLEDVVVGVDRLGHTILALNELFTLHRYPESVIFGHARDGNVHFMLNEQFSDVDSLKRYENFTDDMVDLILGQGGSLKAEHGTGRIMAAFVRRQYGDELYEVMLETKRLFDPNGLLNPGSVLSDDATAYLTDLKTAPAVEEEVDRCVECGFCEPVCPSRNLTTTPRQRIVLRRELQAARDRQDLELVAQLEQQYEYDGNQTCAVDGMCVTVCPVQINTGDLTRRLRSESAGRASDAAWRAAARAWGAGGVVASAGLTAAQRFPAVAEAVTSGLRRIVGDDLVPQYDRRLPGGGRRVEPILDTRPDGSEAPAAVHFPSCMGRMFGADPRTPGPDAAHALRALVRRAGAQLTSPPALAGLCCGTPWKSKGHRSGYAVMAARVLPALWEATQGGVLPIVCEASSCAEGLREMLRAHGEHGQMRVLDATTWVAEQLLDDLPVTSRMGSLALHPTCADRHLGSDAALVRIARHLADEVVVPVAWGCCGFAGDRGLLHPELTASATEAEAAEVSLRAFDGYVSSNRTCELGMTRATGHEYEHILQVLDRATT